jgi:succinyl-diaminopimelate desuccinylase
MPLAISKDTIDVNAQKSHAIEDLQTLIRFESVTPNQAGAIDWLNAQLTCLGFECEQFQVEGVTNLIARISFGNGPNVAFSGHIDVVPAVNGNWLSPPFSAGIVNGAIYGRGAADMKGGVAAMLNATRSLLANIKNKKGSFYWLITSDEEGEALHGSHIISKRLAQHHISLDGCIVGEPTSNNMVGDTIKNGRRGAISSRIKVQGKAGHVAYPENTINAAHIAGCIVSELSHLSWPQDEQGSKTTLQVTGININNVVDNLVPSECEITFNVRYSHGYKSDAVKHRIVNALSEYSPYFCMEWERPCEPYYTSPARNDWSLISHVEQAIYKQTGSYPLLSTSGGTSDGRFFSSGHTQVIECGVRNHTIHQVNEHVTIIDLLKIEKIYTTILLNVFR